MRRLGERLSPAARFGPASAYAGLLDGTLRFAAWQTRRLQNGKLRHYVMTVVLAAAVFTAFPLARQLASFAPPPREAFHVHETAVAAVVALAALAAVSARSRLQAVAALGAAGLGVSVLFALFGAPDLAMTQLAVETLLVVLLVLVFYRLPDFTTRTPPKGRLRDASIALAGGALMAGLVYVAGSTTSKSVAGYYAENSLELAGGRNVVNVILTDFRALDTLGEITVLAAAAIGVYALLRAPGKEAE
jgi:multicomponent Na+:H+ antiporter subunit A